MARGAYGRLRTVFQKLVELYCQLLAHFIFWHVVLEESENVVCESARFCVTSGEILARNQTGKKNVHWF